MKMSAKIMGMVWDLVLSPAERSVLLAMADHADHDGNNVRPSVALIAWKTDYSERQVQRIIGDLRKDGLLVLVRGATPTTPNHYRIDIAAGKQKPAFVPATRGRQDVTPRVDKMSPQDRGDKMSPGDIAMSPRGDIAMSPDPSWNHHKERGGVQTKTPTPAHPALALYSQLTNITPATFTAEMLAEQVTDLGKWEKAIKEWLSSGFKPANVKGMLDWYHGKGRHQSNGKPPERVAPTVGMQPRPPAPADVKPPQEVAAQMKALLDSTRNKNNAS